MKKQVAITGALSYTGRYVTKQLIERFGAENLKIINLARRDLPNPFADTGLEMERHQMDFSKPQEITKALEGSDFFMSSYWVRFDDYKKGLTREQVIANAKMLVDCAKQAGVGRYVYTSHTQSDVNCHIPYIAGKATVEAYVKDQFKNAHGVIKPCGIFGDSPQESILVNNLAYLLRTFPVFAIVGDGKYPFHPVHVEDMARLAIETGLDDHGEKEYDWDAVNPEKQDFIDLLTTIKEIIGTNCYFVKGVPQELAYQCTKPINWMYNDILIDKTDIDLMTYRITMSDKEPRGRIKLSDWVHRNKDQLGQKYISSLQMYYTK